MSNYKDLDFIIDRQRRISFNFSLDSLYLPVVRIFMTRTYKRVFGIKLLSLFQVIAYIFPDDL